MKPAYYPVTAQTEPLLSDRPIYLDNQSTTPVDPGVTQAMLPLFSEMFGNPHSKSHVYGWEANDLLRESRVHVANLIGADSREIIFTSGATESCNIAIRGAAMNHTGSAKKIVTVATEHSCVLETCKNLKKKGFGLSILPVQKDGLIDLNLLEKKLDQKTILVSVMLANNEIGVIQPIKEIAKICQKFGALLHTDATQAVGKIPVDVCELGIDFLSFSAHKFYGPKGAGALYVRWGALSSLEPLMTGGGQEMGLRPGTVALPLVVGLGEASRIANINLEKDMKHAGDLSNELYNILKDKISDIQLYGHPTQRLPGNLNIGFPGVSGEEMIERVGDHLAISTGSACSSSKYETSHVLKALGLSREEASKGVRISIGRFNTREEIRLASKLLINALVE